MNPRPSSSAGLSSGVRPPPSSMLAICAGAHIPMLYLPVYTTVEADRLPAGDKVVAAHPTVQQHHQCSTPSCGLLAAPERSVPTHRCQHARTCSQHCHLTLPKCIGSSPGPWEAGRQRPRHSTARASRLRSPARPQIECPRRRPRTPPPATAPPVHGGEGPFEAAALKAHVQGGGLELSTTCAHTNAI